jgi:Cys-rich repeat protein
VLRRVICTGFSHLLFLTAAVSCALNEPPTTAILSATPDAGTAPPGPSPVVDAGAPPVVVPPIPEEVLPPGCASGATRPCGPSTEAGECALGQRVCVDGVWGDCIGAVYPSVRLCSHIDDQDCDGKPDDSADAVCECVPGTSEPCSAHPGLDGVGACKAGERLCVVAADGQSSRWGACTGAVGPAATDSCLVKGDDANCDATPNSGCNCVEADVVPCGTSDVGICKLGTSTCVNLEWTACSGAVLPGARDCSSSADNDCDGKADDTIDAVCTCEVDSVEPCSEHAEDGVGLCRAGERTCVLGSGRSSSSFGACGGAVGPSGRVCSSSADNNCDGRADNVVDTTCACTIGGVQLCQQHLGLDGVGRCRAGQQLCVAGPNNSSSAFGACSGSVGPLGADSCTVLGDDSNCDGVPNGGCACVAGQGNAACAGSAAASRCDATGACVPCAASADCSLVSGLPVCNAGVCVQCLSDAQCAAGSVCNLTAHACEAAPPPPPPAPVVPAG